MKLEFSVTQVLKDTFLFISNKRSVVLRLLIGFLAGLIAFSSWAISSPPGSSPDENFHIGSIWCGQNFSDNGCKALTADRTEHSIPVNLPHVMDVCFIFYAEQSANCTWDERSKNPELIANNGLYPPGFYWTLNNLVTQNPAESVVTMRIFNSLIFLLLFFAAIFLSPPLKKIAVLVSVMITSIPLGIFIITSINPSGWAYTAAATNWVFLSNFLEDGDRYIKKRVLNLSLYLITVLMALGSRWDVMIYLFISNILVAIIYSKEFRKNKVFNVSIILISSMALILFGMFDRLKGGTTNLTGLGGGNDLISIIDLLQSNIINFFTLYAGNIGYVWGIGWLDTKVPEIVGISGLIIWGLWLSKMTPQMNLKSTITQILSALILISIPIYVLTSERLLVGQQVQPRYLLPLLPIFFGIGIAHSSMKNFTRKNSVNILLITTIYASVANFLSLHTNLRRYVTGTDVNAFNLNLGIEWWWGIPISPNQVLVAGSIAFTIMFAILCNYTLKALRFV